MTRDARLIRISLLLVLILLAVLIYVIVT